jgi:hypothetical protein
VPPVEVHAIEHVGGLRKIRAVLGNGFRHRKMMPEA